MEPSAVPWARAFAPLKVACKSKECSKAEREGPPGGQHDILATREPSLHRFPPAKIHLEFGHVRATYGSDSNDISLDDMRLWSNCQCTYLKSSEVRKRKQHG
ncbi:hypothetical protein AKJ16_DCAP23446 [Drosera capensis]